MAADLASLARSTLHCHNKGFKNGAMLVLTGAAPHVVCIPPSRRDIPTLDAKTSRLDKIKTPTAPFNLNTYLTMAQQGVKWPAIRTQMEKDKIVDIHFDTATGYSNTLTWA